jgi:NACalpha-BTF3-like transcription factor
VKIKAEEVNLIASELEVDKKTAERRLRENQGDLVKALESFLTSAER